MLIIAGFSLVACSSPPPTTIPPRVPLPESGTSSVFGRVFSKKTNEPLVNILVRIARVVRQGGDGAFVLEDAFSPGSLTNEEGYFVISNVDPIEYVIVVGDVNLDYDIIAEDSGRAKVWQTIKGQVLDVGELKVDLP
jgi:hypothetical protein